MKGWAKRLLTTAFCACIVGTPTVVSAQQGSIDKGKIIQLSELGLGDQAIISAIDADAQGLELSEEDLKELEKNGVSKAVLDHLRAAYVPSDGAETPPEGGDGATGPGPGPGMSPGVDPGAPAEESDGTFDAKQVQEILKAVNDLKDEKTKDEQQLNARLVRVKRAIENLQSDQPDNMESARTCLAYLAGYREYVAALDGYQDQFNEIVKGNAADLGVDIDTSVSGEVEAGRYDANYCLAKGLFNENIYSGASRPLVMVLQKGAGPDHPYFKDSFYMLEKVTAKIGYKAPILAEVTAANIKNFNQDFRDDFNYYFGKFFFDSGVMDKARLMLGEVSEEAEDYPEARYLEGVAVLGGVGNSDDALRKVAGDALRAFQDAIIAAEEERGGNEEILQLGYLALARTFYQLGFYNISLYYYQKLPTESSRNAEAKLEQAWAYFLKNDYKKALGLFHMLGSPYYEKWFFPDLDLLEATVYLNLCKYDKSKLALAELDDNFLSKQPMLKDYLSEMQQKEPAESWNALINYYEGEGEAKGLPKMFADAVLDDLAFFNTYKQIQALQVERRALTSNIGALGEFGEDVLAQVDERLSIKVADGGILVLQKLGEIDQQLEQLSLQSTAISFDIEKEEKDTLREQLENPEYARPQAAGGATLLVVADDWHPWPFEGEYWLDEVDNYRSTLRTECVEQ